MNAQDWDSASAVARAFSVGPKESQAVSNLQSRVNAEVVSDLKTAVAVRGMKNFISHDLIARDVFNEGFSSGQGPTEAWVGQLTNSADQRLAT